MARDVSYVIDVLILVVGLFAETKRREDLA